MNDFILYTGRDIPFLDVKVHQPVVGELSELMDEKEFFNLIQVITMQHSEDPKANYQFFMMTLFGWQDILPMDVRIKIIKFLELLFYNYELKLNKEEGTILICKEDKTFILNENNFFILQDIIKKIFAFDLLFKNDKTNDYNPANEKAREIAEKLKKRHQKIVEQKGTLEKSFFGNYLSIVSIGLGIDIKTLSDKLTLFQLLKEFERVSLKHNFDYLLKIKTSFVTAGSSKEPLEDWMKFI